MMVIQNASSDDSGQTEKVQTLVRRHVLRRLIGSELFVNVPNSSPSFHRPEFRESDVSPA